MTVAGGVVGSEIGVFVAIGAAVATGAAVASVAGVLVLPPPPHAVRPRENKTAGIPSRFMF